MTRIKDLFKPKAGSERLALVARVTCALVVGLALVTTGTTHALWSSTKYASTAATINSATLTVEKVGEPVWTDMSIPADPLPIANISTAAPMMQGSVYRFQQAIKTNAGTIPANVRVDLPWLTKHASAQLDVTVSLHDANGALLGSDAILSTSPATGKASFTLPARPGDGVAGFVQITVAYAGANGLNIPTALTLDDVVITLDQITK